jgi:MFS transporter, DHA2 family, multidrug resistance protein
VDFTGLALVGIGVGLLEYTLDRGQEKDWFSDLSIRTSFITAIILLIVFVYWEWRHPDPIVDIKLLKNRNFGTAVFLQLVLGTVLFGTTVLIPQYLQTLLGYTAERAGMVLSPAGFVLMFMMMVAGRLVASVDARALAAFGYFCTAVGVYNLTRLDLNTAYETATMFRIFQVIALPFIFIPISTLNYVGVPIEKNNQISSLSNFARNIGGSAGTALLTTFIARTSQTHQQALAAHSGPGSIGYSFYVNSIKSILISRGVPASQATQMAIGQAYRELQLQASMLSYHNAFFVLAVMIFCLVPLPFVMRLPKRSSKAAPEAAGH